MMTLNLLISMIFFVVTLLFLQLLFLSRYGRLVKSCKRRLDSLESQLTATGRMHSEETKQLKSLELRIQDFEIQRDNTRQLPTSDHDQQLRFAIRMAQRGSSVEDLVMVCGVTRPEAEIVSRMHHRDSNDAGRNASFAQAS